MEYYVYEFYVIDTNEVFYVGKGKGRRAYRKNRNEDCNNMQKTHNWSVRIVQDKMSEEEAFEKEKELIMYYKNNTDYRLTNKTNGGLGNNGWVASKEFREKMSKLVMGEKNPNYGNKWSKEQKDRLSKKRKENGLSKGANNPKAKKVMCVETREVFDYIRIAMEKYSVKCESSFSVAINDKKRTVKGLHWIVIEDEIPSEEETFKYLLECYMTSERKISYICVETKQIFKTRKDLSKHLGLNKHQSSQNFERKLHNGYEYITIKEYYSRIYQ